MRIALVLVAAACGRVGFDPLGGPEAGASGGDGGAPSGDGRPTDGTPDGLTNACASAIPVQVGNLVSTSTCVGGDRLDGCGPPGTQEVVFAFTPSSSAGYSFRAFDHGAMSVSNSTAEVAAGCTQVQSNCSGILGFPVLAGQTVYLIVEADLGGCAMIDFSVM